jgi:hypothetical protein
MTIIDAVWTPVVNMLVLRCRCGVSTHHRADRWRVVCEGCRASAHLGAIRAEYVRRGGLRK